MEPTAKRLKTAAGPAPANIAVVPVSGPVRKRHQTTNVQKSVAEMFEMWSSGVLRVPGHQRGYKWKEPMAVEFIDTVLTNGPTLSFVVNESFDVEKNHKVYDLENGFQRLTTLKRYENDEFKNLEGQFYSELSPKEKQYIRDYQLQVCIVCNLTQKEIITQFERLNQSVSLTTAERISSYSKSNLSPLLRLAQRHLFAPDGAFRPIIERLTNIATVNNPKQIYSLLALMSGCANGWETMSQKWTTIKNHIETPVNEEHLLTQLRHVLSIYEGVAEGIKGPKKSITAFLKKLWDPSYTTATILYSQPETDSQVWTEFILELYANPALDRAFRGKRDGEKSNGRAWGEKRWKAQANVLRTFYGDAEVEGEGGEGEEEEGGEDEEEEGENI